MPRRGAPHPHAVRRSLSTSRNDRSSWFQLAKMRLPTSLPVRDLCDVSAFLALEQA